MPMKDPPHPGLVVLDGCIEPLGLTISAAARALGVSRNQLSEVVKGKRAISPDLAVRLEKSFGSTAQTWLRMQHAFDMAQAEQRADAIQVEQSWRPETQAAE